MPPKISVSDDEFDRTPEEMSDSDDVSDPELDDDDDVEADEPEQEEDDLEDDFNLEEYSEEAYEAEEEKARPQRGGRPKRESKKRQLALYDDDEMMDSEEDKTPATKRLSIKLKIPRRSAAQATTRSRAEDLFTEEEDYKPDVLKLTERQRARLEEDSTERYEDLTFAKMDEQLLSLNRKTAKKKETAEQLALRKAENARKRAHYKTRQLEEEKRDTLNKLLKRRANKTREKAVDDAPEVKQTLKPRRPTMEHPALMRWVCRADKSVLGTN